MRTMIHPGPLDRRRSIALEVRAAPALRVRIPQGGDLLLTVHARLDELGAASGGFVLVEGDCSSLELMTGGPAPGSPLTFHGPHRIATPARVAAGSGICGVDEKGGRSTHSHAAFRDCAGKPVGGHLIPGKTIAGEGGLVVELHPVFEGRFVRRSDPETGFNIFYPEPA